MVRRFTPGIVWILVILLGSAMHGRIVSLAAAARLPIPCDPPCQAERYRGQRHLAADTSPAIEPYVRPDVQAWLTRLRPHVLATAARHNDPARSGMSDREFAAVLVTVLLNEQNGWLEDGIEPLRLFTPLYQDAQIWANEAGLGSNFSVWPANLRPSVASEILARTVPVPGGFIQAHVVVAGSQIDPAGFSSREELFAAITREIRTPELAIEYLAANLERGVHRARFEQVAVTWRALAAWHNQGIVTPADIRANPTAAEYVWRASAYRGVALAFVAHDPALTAGRAGLRAE